MSASTARTPRSAAPLEAPEGGRRRSDAPALEVVTPRRRRRGWQVGTVAGVVLFVALFAVAGFQALIVSSQKRIDELDRSIVAATDEAQQLENRLALLQSPQRITAEATERLGMLTPPGVGYLIPAPDDDARAAVVPAPSSIAPEVAEVDAAEVDAAARSATADPVASDSGGPGR